MGQGITLEILYQNTDLGCHVSSMKYVKKCLWFLVRPFLVNIPISFPLNKNYEREHWSEKG